MKTYDWIVNESKLPWLKLNISFPYEEMHREAVSLKEYFVAHRDKDGDAASGGVFPQRLEKFVYSRHRSRKN